MVHADVDPSDEILLRDVLAVEELVEVDDRFAGEMHVPLATRRRLGVLALRDREVVAGPVGVVQETLGADDGLRSTNVRVMFAGSGQGDDVRCERASIRGG